ncbi:unnamed protein product [Amaranthus hypochondriacus]
MQHFTFFRFPLSFKVPFTSLGILNNKHPFYYFSFSSIPLMFEINETISWKNKNYSNLHLIIRKKHRKPSPSLPLIFEETRHNKVDVEGDKPSQWRLCSVVFTDAQSPQGRKQYLCRTILVHSCEAHSTL